MIESIRQGSIEGIDENYFKNINNGKENEIDRRVKEEILKTLFSKFYSNIPKINNENTSPPDIPYIPQSIFLSKFLTLSLV